jgi:hypothetical protein
MSLLWPLNRHVPGQFLLKKQFFLIFSENTAESAICLRGSGRVAKRALMIQPTYRKICYAQTNPNRGKSKS